MSIIRAKNQRHSCKISTCWSLSVEHVNIHQVLKVTNHHLPIRSVDFVSRLYVVSDPVCPVNQLVVDGDAKRIRSVFRQQSLHINTQQCCCNVSCVFNVYQRKVSEINHLFNSNQTLSLSPFYQRFSRWTCVSQYQNVTILDFIGAKNDGGGEW